MTTFDLNDLDTVGACEQGLTFNVRDASGEETPMQVTVYGPHSKAFKAARVKLTAGREKLLKERAGEETKISVDEDEALLSDFTAECVKGWSSFTLNGAEFTYSKANAKTLIKNYPLIAIQTYEKIHSLQEFMVKPQKTSETTAE